MLSPVVVNAMLAVIAVLLVVLLVRVVLKWWRGRSTGRVAETPSVERPVTHEPVAASEPVTPQPNEPTVGSDRVYDLDGVETTAAGGTATATRTQRRTQSVPAWNDRRLFSTGRGDNHRNDLPHLRPDQSPSADTGDYVFGAGLTPALASLLPESEDRADVVRSELVNAGYYEPHAYQNLSAVRYVGIMLMLVLFGGLLIILPEQFELFALAGLVVGPLLAWSLPRLTIRGRVADRLSEIERGMPDMLDMLNMCVSQGLTLQQALGRISREMYDAYPALAQELAIVVEQSRVGSMEHALRNFEKRVDLPEVHSFVALVTQTERMGTSVSEALVDYSDGMRESLRQRADTKANQATFKLLFPTVLCLMPAVYLFLLGPAIIEFTNFVENGGLDAVSQGGTAVQNLQAAP